MPLCVLPFSAMPFSARYLYDGGFFSISSSYRGLSFTNFDSVYFRFDLTLFTFRLLNFVIDIPSYLYDSGFFSISSSYRGLSCTTFDSVYFRFDLTLFTFRLLNFVIDIPS